MCRLCKTIHGFGVPSGKLTKNYGQSPFSMGKLTISMAIFHSYVELPEGTRYDLTTHFCSEWTWISRNISVMLWLKIHHPPKGYGMNFNARPFLISCWNPFFFCGFASVKSYEFHVRLPFPLVWSYPIFCCFNAFFPGEFPTIFLLNPSLSWTVNKVCQKSRDSHVVWQTIFISLSDMVIIYLCL